ncbi:cysteine--tRNA ligase [Candidatus Daviesbacteria bacterium RIFCSPHIGHO2_01_FULL_40_11]|uniref:Cysteine--tRNA ligase n=1 Tax=Candidatus Daviesbacteria bacterium RIFCSPHIGHO2_01_FULL_40_11 TaxID=1797762 RepID=A0A1F5JGK4_9BACT|nr:MAG: cysteine--tRNA ligase [Candidatus Daviesbacteria bacterium RIFCSPHIGHO2_01_FULL_40_11]
MTIYNSLSGKLEEFKPLKDKKVTIYVCGITPYDTTHLGHAFTYISFDVLIRYLRFLGFNVSYAQNVTDVNDRDHDILDRAKEQHVSWKKLADFWTRKFLNDMHALNWIHPHHFAKASRHTHHMVDLIRELLDKKLAYQKNGSVYLDTAKFPDYGKLSKLKTDEMFKVSRDFEEDLQCPEKRHPLDVTLWRASTPDQPKHIPSFNSPFGKGRPGWHIECSAMSMEYLGDQIDIHGGGIDLKFPHHEAEIAQSEGATGKIPFVRYWLHTGTVHYLGKKMSKSEGNLELVSDILKKYSPNAIRWLLLSHHFSKSWEYEEKDLIQAQKNVNLVENAIKYANELTNNDHAINTFTQILDQNLDTPKALDFLLKMTKRSAKGLENLYTSLGFSLKKSKL